MAFVTAVDIANRALQHCGALRISSFSDTSKNAAEASFLYDKTREAELRRVIWRFATRRVALRAITATTVVFNPAAYAAGTTYALGAVVVDTAGIVWISLAASNTGNTPGAVGSAGFWAGYYGPLTADTWSSAVTYYAGELAVVSSTLYISIANGNLNNAPSGGAPWVSLGTGRTLVLTFLHPLGFATSELTTSRSLFRLPNAYLRMAPQDPKSANVSVLNTSAGVRYSDFQIEGNYIVSQAGGPLIFRYVCDMVDVPNMDSMFCEGLAARMALELVEPLTQSVEKFKMIQATYSQWMREARAINAIEVGSTEQNEEDFSVMPAQAQPLGPQQQQQG